MRDKVIIDTNLWISFLISRDYSKLDTLLLSGKCILIFNEELLEEFLTVSQRPKFRKFFSVKEINLLLTSLEEYMLFINNNSVVNICRDEKDNFLLALAVDAKADYLLTGDKDLLELNKIRKTRIITISSYLALKK